MDAYELTKLFKWINSSSTSMYYAFALKGTDRHSCELQLSRVRRGKSILYQLSESDIILASRRYGIISTDSVKETITFTAQKAFGSREDKALKVFLKQVLKGTDLRSFTIVITSDAADSEDSAD